MTTTTTTTSTTTTTIDPLTVPPAERPAVAPPTVAVSTPDAVAEARAQAWTVAPYYGLGAWLDAFDWSVTFARKPEHTVGVEAIDHMAAEGVQTVYIQASRWNSETDIIEPERLNSLIERAHAHGMSVIGWYLPTLVDLELDYRRLLSIAALDVDGIGVDIESREVDDIGERNWRLLELSRWLDDALGDRTLGAIVLEPVIMEDVNPRYWPDFPWLQLAEHYDVWLPMSYWTNRRDHWRSAHLYTATNMVRLRERIGQPGALVHTIGGIGDRSSTNDYVEMVAAAVEHGAIGGSIYDYRTTDQSAWEVLRSFRSG